MTLFDKRKKQSDEPEVTMKEYLEASMELERLQKEHGIEVEEKGGKENRQCNRFFAFFQRKG